MNTDDLNSHEEQALDALLSEVLGGTSPPDLSQQILHRYQSGDGPVVVDVRDDMVTQKKSIRPIVTGVSIVAAVAACMLAVVWIRHGGSPDDQRSVVAENQIDPVPEEAPIESVAQQPPPADVAPDPRPLPKGIPLVSGDQTPQQKSARPIAC